MQTCIKFKTGEEQVYAFQEVENGRPVNKKRKQNDSDNATYY